VNQSTETTYNLPENVPAELVVDYNFYSEPAVRDVQLDASRALHGGQDIVWTFRNGGHWIFTRADDIEYAQKDSELFSMREVTLPAGVTPNRNIPLETDGEEHHQFRAVLQPNFAPGRIMAMEDNVRDLAISLIEGFRARGRCEFVSDFASQLPIAIFMNLADLPLSDRVMLLGWANQAVRPSSFEARIDAYNKTNEYIVRLMEERRNSQADDLISCIMRGRMADREMTEAEKQSMIQNVLFGGLDTVTSAMSFIAWFLAGSPEHRRQLAERPDLIQRAIEELLRRHGVTNTARVITRDFDYKGIHFRAGDGVLVQSMLHGLDSRRYENPESVDFERPASRHAVFGNGPHRCVGALLARVELKVYLQEWMSRIPEFRLDTDDPPRAEGGMVNSVTYVPLRWDI